MQLLLELLKIVITTQKMINLVEIYHAKFCNFFLMYHGWLNNLFIAR